MAEKYKAKQQSNSVVGNDSMVSRASVVSQPSPAVVKKPEPVAVEEP